MKPNESFIEQPVRSLQTMLRVLSQADSRIPSVIPDGIYGPTTSQAVSAFQRIHSLPITGVTNQQTWDAIVPQYELALVNILPAAPIEIVMDPFEVYRLGDSSPYIYLLQSLLVQLSRDYVTIPTPPHSGILDNETSEAIIAFQKLALLPETGEFDKLTWKHLVNQFTLNAVHNHKQ